MRIGPAVAFVFVLFMVGCSGGSSNGSGGGGTPAPSAPTANAGGPYAGIAGTGVTFSSTGSSDPQGQALTYAWSFGDNATGTGMSPTHIYAQPGSFIVSLMVTNTSGLTGTTTSKVTIAIAPLADSALTGTVMSGTAPVLGAHVYLLAAGTTGYGGNGIAASSTNASVSLLSAAETGASDAVGAYVVTNASGAFSLTGDYSCSSGQQLYLYASGGNAGGGTNSAIGLMALLGSCPSTMGSAISAVVNEVSTVAAAYSTAGFATDATHVGSSGTALAKVGIANAFANAGNLVTLNTGAALATTPAANGTVPQAEINTLGNVLAGCVRASGPGVNACTNVFANALAGGTMGAQPVDTATAAMNIAHNPGANVAGVYTLGSGAVYALGLTTQPTDWTVQLGFSNNGLSSSTAIAIDGIGNVWVTNSDEQVFNPTPDVTELNSLGASLSGSTGFSGGGLSSPGGMAIDESNNVWVTNPRGQSVVEISPTGTFLSGATGYSTGASSNLGSIAIDAAGNAWIADGSSVLKMSPTGSLSSGPSGYGFGNSNAFLVATAIDPSGNIWLPNKSGNELMELSSSGVSLSGAGGYTGGGLSAPIAAAIDSSGNIWILDSTDKNTVSKFSSTGSSLSGSFGFPFGTNGLQLLPSAIAIDGGGEVWVSTYSVGDIEELSNSGSLLSPTANYGYAVESNAGGIAVDGSGNVWISNLLGGPVIEMVGAAVPVVTPISVGVKNNMLGTRP